MFNYFFRFHKRTPQDFHILGDTNGHYRLQSDILGDDPASKSFPTVTQLIQYYKSSSDDSQWYINSTHSYRASSCT